MGAASGLAVFVGRMCLFEEHEEVSLAHVIGQAGGDAGGKHQVLPEYRPHQERVSVANGPGPQASETCATATRRTPAPSAACMAGV